MTAWCFGEDSCGWSYLFHSHASQSRFSFSLFPSITVLSLHICLKLWPYSVRSCRQGFLGWVCWRGVMFWQSLWFIWGLTASYSIARALSVAMRRGHFFLSMYFLLLSIDVVSSKSFWRTRALSAFAKLYAALRMQFLRLLHANLSTDLFSTFIFHFTANLVFHSFQIGDGS